MTLTIDKNFYGCCLLIADAYGFHPTRAKWHQWEETALEYERMDPRYVGWWLQQFTVGTVTAEEAKDLGAALTLALMGGEMDPNAKALEHPDFPRLLEEFKTAEGRVAARDIVVVCKQGAFAIDSSQMEYRVVLSNLKTD